ncbi:MAG: hypothetical protein V4662_24325 [Verrucomicrobiota bacterium]
MTDIWIGSRYDVSEKRIFVLGESTYGSDPVLVDYIPTWIRRQVRDTTFSRIFNGFSGNHTSRATDADRETFWSRIAFYNFVTRSVGPTREHRPTGADYSAAQTSLEAVLRRHSPAAVVILGTEQAQYSVPVVERLGICYVVTRHPTSYRLQTKVLTDAWNEVLGLTSLDLA